MGAALLNRSEAQRLLRCCGARRVRSPLSLSLRFALRAWKALGQVGRRADKEAEESEAKRVTSR